MEIPFVQHSRFLATCVDNISRNRDRLMKGAPLNMTLEASRLRQAHNDNHSIRNRQEFGTDWEGNDPTWFPVRIRAAATALRDCACYGTFIIDHQDAVSQYGKLNK